MKNVTFPKILKTYNLTIEKRRRLAQIFILGLWALIQYSLGNKFYGLFGILFLLIFFFYRPRYFKVFAVIVLLMALFSSHSVDTWTDLIQSNLDTVQHLQLTLANILTPNSGREVLPGKVQQMLSLFGKYHITNYRLSNRLEQDESINQRIIESAWPKKKDSTSFYLICLIEEIKNNPTCDLIGKRKDVALVYCH